MSLVREWCKAPADVMDVVIDWSATGIGVLPTGDTIASSTWTVDAGITKGTTTNTTTSTTCWVSGGTVGGNYLLTNTIVTAGGRTLTRCATVHVRLVP